MFFGSEARAIAPLVTEVNSTNTRQSDYFGRGSRPGPDIAWFRGILVQRKVAAIDVVVRNVLGQQAAQMCLIEIADGERQF